MGALFFPFVLGINFSCYGSAHIHCNPANFGIGLQLQEYLWKAQNVKVEEVTDEGYISSGNSGVGSSNVFGDAF